MTLKEFFLLQYARDQKKTQAHFAKFLGITRHHLCRIVNGYNRPSYDLAFKIHKLTKGEITVEQLMKIGVEK